MKILKIYPSSVNMRFIEEAVDHLRGGGTVIYPTDTLYAVGCDALNNGAIETVCRLKGLDPRKQHLSVVCADISQASEYAKIDNVAFRMLKQHLPGPFTFVLPASTRLPKVFKGRHTVGIRIPDNAIAVELARQLGRPILTTSVPMPADGVPSEPDEIALECESAAQLMIDGGSAPGLPSTVVDLTDSDNPEILRQGLGQFDI